MGRTHLTPIKQPDNRTCGPAALKLALQMFGKRLSVATLATLCKTNRNGTSTKNIIRALNSMGFAVEMVEYATLKHLQSALKYKPGALRAALVTYLYDLDEKEQPHPDSGHWALVYSYSASKSRIVLLDSSNAKKKSYQWADFRNRWIDFDLKRRTVDNGRSYKLVRKWQSQLLLVFAKNTKDLPGFRISTAKIFPPVRRKRKTSVRQPSATIRRSVAMPLGPIRPSPIPA